MDQLQELARWLDGQVEPGRWHDKIYSYCERGGDASFWAEPLNAWSNGAFHIAALMAFLIWLTAPSVHSDTTAPPGGQPTPSERAGQEKPRRGLFELFLVLLVFAIGTGSFLFHTLANRWSAIADVAPISIFMLLYFGYTLKRFAGLGWIPTLLGVGVFIYVLWQFGQMRCGQTLCLKGSIAYVPAFTVLAIMGLWLVATRHPAAATLIAGACLLATSLTLRTFDNAWCRSTRIGDYGPIGTHFWWHLLNAILLFILLRAAILYGRPSTAPSR